MAHKITDKKRRTMKSIDILLVEDNPADARLTTEALKDGKLCNYQDVHHVLDGEQAINYLSKCSPYENVKTPDLVLLDINLPKVNGMEVLEFIRSNKSISNLAVVILTTSESDKDILKSYNLHVNCYITKPVDLSSFIDVVHNIEYFWFSVVKLPARD